MRQALPAALLLLILGACQRPPPEAYVSASGEARNAEAQPIGNNAQNEPCVMQATRPRAGDAPGARGYEIFCGGWQQPAARLSVVPGADLDGAVAGGIWRDGLDRRAACGPAQPTTVLDGLAARGMSCTRRQGGWPHVAVAARSGSDLYLADGVLPSLPVMEAAIARASGRAPAAVSSAQTRSAALELLAGRAAGSSFGSDDIARFDEFMQAGSDLNQIENFAAAENAYRAALTVHEQALGADNPAGAMPAMALALQLSNQGRYPEADTLFARAGRLAPRATDQLSAPRLAHYRALHAGNQRNYEDAVRRAAEAERAYAALVPADQLRPGPQRGQQVSFGRAGVTNFSDIAGDRQLVSDPVSAAAITGYADARRYRALMLLRMGRVAEAQPLAAEARELSRATAVESPVLSGRAARVAGETLAASNAGSAVGLFQESARLLARGVPNERPVAYAQFQAGSALLAAGARVEALAAFRDGARILRERRTGLSAEAISPYLDALYEEATRAPNQSPTLSAELFEAAQLIRSGITAQLISQAAARLGAGAGDERVATAVRRMQDQEAKLSDLSAQRDQAADAPSELRDAPLIARLDEQIRDAQRARAEAEDEVQAAAPGYRQLVQGGADTAETLSRLRPNEALAFIVPPASGTGRSGYTVVLRGDRATVGRVALTAEQTVGLVKRIRAGVELQYDAAGRPVIPTFDTAAAHELYRALFAAVEPQLQGLSALVIAPAGPLLSLPFDVLVTAPPVAGQRPAFLLAKAAISHVPSVQTFVSLRKATEPSKAAFAYLGFGDFQPMPARLLATSFPADRCGQDAQSVQGLGALPGTRREVAAAERLLGASANDVVLGGNFTPASVKGRKLSDYRIVHFAAHAVLPSEIRCLSEPAILASAPVGATDAGAAFITASDVLGMKMDADLALLSACNSGGPGGATGGEALSGLARAFFYAGARGLMVTHWSVDDTASAIIVADTLRRMRQGTGTAAALRASKIAMIEEAESGRLPDVFSHPFFWAPFALIGDGRAGGVSG